MFFIVFTRAKLKIINELKKVIKKRSLNVQFRDHANHEKEKQKV